MGFKTSKRVTGGVASALALLAGAATASAAPTDPQACAALARLHLPHVDITSAQSVAAASATALPATCQVKGVSRPTADSQILFEVWMPSTTWNGRFLGTGNGSLAGSIEPMFLQVAVRGGYAVAATDTGHEANGLDGAWALNHPERIRDYGYRGIHETAVVGKALVASFYGRPAAHAYFASASNGGRAGLMEAERFPHDYDGILAGSPAFDVSERLASWAWTQQQLEKPGAWLSPETLGVVQAAALKACDGADGVVDGVIDDPRTCRFDPQVLLCKPGQAAGCLTSPQIVALRAIYSGPPRTPGDTSRHYGFAPGGEAAWPDWITGKTLDASLEYHFGQEFYRYLVYGRADWTLKDFHLAADRPRTRALIGSALDADDPDLRAFFARGGKLIMYQGWSDPALEPAEVIDYYGRVRQRVGAAQADGSMRLFMVPGMEHVFGGSGPSSFGQLPPGDIDDPARNITAALVTWVERGRAPNEIIAAKYASSLMDLAPPPGAQPLRTRPLCAYPQVAKWTGTGSTDLAANFRCMALPE